MNRKHWHYIAWALCFPAGVAYSLGYYQLGLALGVLAITLIITGEF